MKKWITESETKIVTCPALDVVEKHCVSEEDGRKHKFYALTSSEWANVIPVTADGKVVMVKQFRVGLGDFTLEFPGGLVDGDEKPFAAALREMEEETGYTLPDLGSTIQSLGWAYPNPAILNNKCYSFIAGPVEKNQSQKLDSGEMVEIVEVPIEDLPKLIAEGQIRHALMLNSIFWFLFNDGYTKMFLKTILPGFWKKDRDPGWKQTHKMGVNENCEVGFYRDKDNSLALGIRTFDSSSHTVLMKEKTFLGCFHAYQTFLQTQHFRQLVREGLVPDKVSAELLEELERSLMAGARDILDE